MLVLGINLSPHDRSIAVVKDGEVICAIEEERITREKHGFTYQEEYYTLEQDAEYFDQNFLLVSSAWLDQKIDIMLAYIEEALHLQWQDFDVVVCANLYPQLPSKTGMLLINHHLAHAANTFYLSDYPKAAIMIADGSGNFSNDEFETISFYQGLGKQIIPLRKYSGKIKDYCNQPNNSLIGLYNSMGALYKNIASLVGCGNMGEGKMMGLASYGQPIYRHLFIQYIASAHDTLQIDNQAIYLALKKVIAELPEFSFQSKADIARSCQEMFNEVFLDLSKQLHNLYPSENLCVAGGCFLNAITNSFLVANSAFKNFFVPSSPGDNGIAVGAALYGYYQHNQSPRIKQKNLAYWGKTYSAVEIDHVLAKYKAELGVQRPSDIYQATAELLAAGNVVGWFQSGSEFGPRALGNRSILASPIQADMKDYLNNEVKFRENYRPVAPAILKENATEYFFGLHHSRSFELMTLVAMATPLAQERIPAAVHVDGSARVQIVSAESNQHFYALLKAFFAYTKVPVLINTSFNLKDEPIVETPDHALQTFLRSKLDALVLGDVIVKRLKR